MSESVTSVERKFMVTRTWPDAERLIKNTPSIEVIDLTTGQLVSSEDLSGLDLKDLSVTSTSCDPDEAFKSFDLFTFDDIYKLQQARDAFIEEHKKSGRKTHGLIGPSKSPRKPSTKRTSTTGPKATTTTKKSSAMMASISARLLMLEQAEKSNNLNKESPNA